jgi:periplasmic copper chaperone A
MKKNLMKLKNYLYALATLLNATSMLYSSSLFAHVVLAETAILVKIPDDFENVKPMPKPGWTIETKMEKLSKPIESHGKRITETVRQITWRGGPLLDQHYDEFVMMMKLPEHAGKRWLPVVQICEKGSVNWDQIPNSGETNKYLKTPAAELNIVPTTMAGAQAH